MMTFPFNTRQKHKNCGLWAASPHLRGGLEDRVRARKRHYPTIIGVEPNKKYNYINLVYKKTRGPYYYKPRVILINYFLSHCFPVWAYIKIHLNPTI